MLFSPSSPCIRDSVSREFPARGSVFEVHDLRLRMQVSINVRNKKEASRMYHRVSIRNLKELYPWLLGLLYVNPSPKSRSLMGLSEDQGTSFWRSL